MDIDDLSYCTPDEVSETLDLPDPDDPMGMMRFTDTTHPSFNQVCRMIRSNEDIIDRRLKKSWRVNRVKDYICDIESYQMDEHGWRNMYFQMGGNFCQLRKDMLPWDPLKGDKLEIRSYGNTWIDISDTPLTSKSVDEGPNSWALWFDYPMGKMYIRTRVFQPRYNALRITYRYGAEQDEVPYAIKRLCSLMTATQILNMGAFNVKIGAGGDISGIKDNILSYWADEMGQIWSSYQRAGSVHSLLR